MKLLLCVLQTILCFFFIKSTYKYDKPNAIFLGALFVYSVFPEINYALYPEFIFEYVYLKKENWMLFFLFITFSFSALYLFNRFFISKKTHLRVVIQESGKNGIIISYIILICYSLVLLYSIGVIFLNWSSFSYSNNVLKFYSRQISLVRQLNDWNVYYFLILITAIKNNKNNKRKKRWMCLSCCLCVTSLVLFTFLNGDRSVILLCIVGGFVSYFYDKPFGISSLRKMIPIILIGVFYLFFIRNYRSGNAIHYDYVKTILQDDYAYPGMTILAAMEKGFVHPIEVMKSFIAKSSVIIPGKYLYWKLYESMFPKYIEQSISTGANAGIGFHLFTEGYIFAGDLGFIYNGLFISILLRFWRHFYSTNDEQTNIILAAIASGIFVIGVRSETAYFIRNFIFYMFPAIMMCLLVCGKKMKIAISIDYKGIG